MLLMLPGLKEAPTIGGVSTSISIIQKILSVFRGNLTSLYFFKFNISQRSSKSVSLNLLNQRHT